jgi:protein-ribulosamine 3-kinase
VGKVQLEGEFTGMSELHKLMPNMVPKPYAWGQLKDVTSPVSFFLIEFKNFLPGLPDPVKLGSRLAELHQKSVSPTGQFGFHLTTYDGAKTQVLDWDPSWASFFSKLLAEAYRHDLEANGRWDELDRVFARTRSHLVQRLLGVLESDGRSIKPCLIHGDLWEGNIGNDIETGDPWIFDAAAYYAHNEMELGIWRAERHDLRAKIYRNAYLQIMHPSEPADECDDRNRLYSVKTNLMYSACVPGAQSRHL